MTQTAKCIASRKVAPLWGKQNAAGLQIALKLLKFHSLARPHGK
jgi:hypothetical protein